MSMNTLKATYFALKSKPDKMSNFIETRIIIRYADTLQIISRIEVLGIKTSRIISLDRLNGSSELGLAGT